MKAITTITPGGSATDAAQEATQNAALGNATAANPAVAVSDPTRDISVKSAAAQEGLSGASLTAGAVIASGDGNTSQIEGDGTVTVNTAERQLTHIERRFADVATAELATGSDNDPCYVISVDTPYRYEASGGAYTRDGTFVLNTGDGGNTRWIAVGGKYKIDGLSALRVSNDATGIVESYTQSRGAAGQDNDILWQKSIYGYNDAAGTPEKIEYGRIKASITDASDGTEDGSIEIGTIKAGSYSGVLVLGGGTVSYNGGIYQNTQAINYSSGWRISQASALTAYPALKVWGEQTGATDNLLLVHQDHVSNTGTLIKGLTDGSGTLLDLERGTTADATGGVLKFTRTRGAAAGQDADVLIQAQFFGHNDAGTPEDIEFTEIAHGIVDASDGTEDGYISLQTMAAGTLTETLRCDSGVVGIGDTTPSTSAKRLFVSDNTTGATNPVAYFKQNHASNTGYVVRIWNEGSGSALSVGGGTTSPTVSILRYSTSAGCISTSCTANSATAAPIDFYRYRSGAGVDSDGLTDLRFYGYNNNATPEAVVFASLATGIVDASDGTEDGYISLKTMAAGTLTETLRCDSGVVGIGGTNPSASAKRLYVYDNTTGATNPLVYIRQDHASNTSSALSITHDGSGEALTLNVATGRTMSCYSQAVGAANFYFQATNNSASSPAFYLYRTRGGTTAGVDADEIFKFSFVGRNDAATPQDIEYARIITGIVDASDGTEGGSIALKVADGVDGSLDTMVEIKGKLLGLYGVTPTAQAAYSTDPTAIAACLVNVGLMLPA